MTERWTVEEEQQKIERHLPKNYRWYHTPAVKIHKHRQAMEGIIIEIKNNIRKDKIIK